MNRTAYLLLLLTTLFWGGNAIAGKLAIDHVSPMLLTALRWAFAFVLLLPFSWNQLRRDWTIARGSLLWLFLLGALGFTAFNIALYSALMHTSAINVSIEQAAIPMVIFVANFLLFGTRITLLQIVGFLLSVAGVAVVASHGDPRRLLALDLNVGDALMLVGIAVYSAYTLMLRFKPDIHWQSMMVLLTASAALTSLPFVGYETAAGTLIWPDAQGWMVVAYTVIFPSLMAQVFYMRGVELIGPNRAGLFINLVPIFGTVLAIALLGEAVEAYHAVAILMVMGGIAIAEWSGRRIAV